MTQLLARIGLHRVKSWGFSFFSGAVVVGLFVLIQALVPRSLNYYYETVTLLFLLASVAFLFPARDYLERRLFGRNYAAIFGGSHHLDFMATRFTEDSIIHEVFPELMQWMGVRAAKLAIPDSSRRHFTYHIYSEGTKLRTRVSYYHSMEPLIRYAKQKRESLAPESAMPEEIRRILVRIHAALFFPICYRNKMVAFLILHNAPENKYAERALDTFAGKAAASIQNALLSARFMDATAIQREFMVADKIRRFLSRMDVPAIPGVSIESFSNEGMAVVVEFFPGEKQSWFAVMMGTDRLNGSSAIVLSSMLGSLYSLVRRESGLTLHKLLTHFRRERSPELYERIDLCLLELRPRDAAMFLMLDGPGFNARNPDKPDRILTSSGWRSVIDTTENACVRFQFQDRPVLQFRF
jgi:hypothetical protein